MNYLHELSVGKYDNNLRKKVRKLFSDMTIEDEPATVADSKQLAIIVGILEEFKSIGIKKFTIDQVAETIKIFKLEGQFGENLALNLFELLSGPKVRLYAADRIYDLPDDSRLANLKQQFHPKPQSSAVPQT